MRTGCSLVAASRIDLLGSKPKLERLSSGDVARLESNKSMISDEVLPRPRCILVTGANRGIGFATAVALARRGHELVLTARRPSDIASLESRILQAVPGTVATFHHLDLASFASIRRFAHCVLSNEKPIQILLHNAGLVIPSDQRRMTEDGIEENLAVAAVGPMLLSLALQPMLARPSRLVGVNSALHKPGTFGDAIAFRLDDPHLTSAYTSTCAYKNAKLAQLWFLFEWERRFGADRWHADAVSPGFVPGTAAQSAHGVQRFLLRFIWPMFPFSTSLEQAVPSVVRVCEEDLDAPGGHYFEGQALSEASLDARSQEKSAAFWAMAESWIEAGIKGP